MWHCYGICLAMETSVLKLAEIALKTLKQVT